MAAERSPQPASVEKPSAERIRAAVAMIDPTFCRTPDVDAPELARITGAGQFRCKVETLNPIGSFKGRGASLYFATEAAAGEIVCASVGNFGQGMAWAARARDRKVHVFASPSANTSKLDRMRRLGAVLHLQGEDFDAAKDAARSFALDSGMAFVEDGRELAVTEGAGTIGVEITEREAPDVVLLPVGNGALANGIGTWLRAVSPATRTIGVCAEGAPAMAHSFASRVPVEFPVGTIADGVAVRVPIPEAVAVMCEVVDDVRLVSDDDILRAVRLLAVNTGLVVEPAGALGLAAAVRDPELVEGRRVATVLTGRNVTAEQLTEWFVPAGPLR